MGQRRRRRKAKIACETKLKGTGALCTAGDGPGRLTPRRIPFVRLALRADRFLLRGLVLAVLPPLFQLEINELPHHPGLRQADSCQTSHPEGRRCKANVFILN